MQTIRKDTPYYKLYILAFVGNLITIFSSQKSQKEWRGNFLLSRHLGIFEIPRDKDEHYNGLPCMWSTLSSFIQI